ncbi:MAG: 50S ribosomal protein L10 [bacterium]|nr:50S ribosomal protein L10 [bacterium]
MSTEIKIDKSKKIEEIKSKVDTSVFSLIADFRGLSVSEVTGLRQKLRDSGAEMTVYKNTLARRALQDLKIDYPAEMLIGPSALVNTEGDPIALAKILVDFIKESEALKIKGGLLDGENLDKESIIQLSELPGRDELIAKSVALIKSPVTNFVMILSGQIRNLINVMNAIKEKKQEVKND